MPKLSAGELVMMTSAELRALDVNGVRQLLHELGLEVEGIEDRNSGLTRLMENALDIEDVE